MSGMIEPEPTAWQARWAALPDWARGGLPGKIVNPHNLTRIHLAHLIRRHGFRIGGASYGRPKIRFPGSGATLSIGRFCSFADGVDILLGGNHRTDWISTYPFPEFAVDWPEAAARDDHHATRGHVTIGHDVWIGSQAMILSGVTIGHGAVVAARSVVTRDVPPYSIVAGNPARPVKQRFGDAAITALLDASWWNWSRDRIARNLPLLMSGDVAGFLADTKES